MARPLAYRPPVVDPHPPADQVAELVAALDEQGVLRALTGFVRAFPDVAEVVVARLDADTLRSLLALGHLFQDLDPETVERIVDGARSAVASGGSELDAAQPPSLLDIVKRLGDPDVRRGAAAVLAALGTFGGTVRTRATT